MHYEEILIANGSLFRHPACILFIAKRISWQSVYLTVNLSEFFSEMEGDCSTKLDVLSGIQRINFFELGLGLLMLPVIVLAIIIQSS